MIDIDTSVSPKVAFVDQTSSNADQFYWSGVYSKQWSFIKEQDFGFVLNAVGATREHPDNLWGSTQHADFGADTTITSLTVANEQMTIEFYSNGMSYIGEVSPVEPYDQFYTQDPTISTFESVLTEKSLVFNMVP